MAPPTWTALSAATRDPRYAAYGDREFWATTRLSAGQGRPPLFPRQPLSSNRRDDQGRKIFWSRGNGWAYRRDRQHPARRCRRTIPTARATSPCSARCRRGWSRCRSRTATGRCRCWRPSTDPPETSGTGFFVYGLAWGVNQGLLKRSEIRRVRPPGLVGLGPRRRAGRQVWAGCSRSATRPTTSRPATPSSMALGAFLLAASEVSRGRL
ncbi:glycoside hydrolase family 88 protein [Caulobacter segnis]